MVLKKLTSAISNFKFLFFLSLSLLILTSCNQESRFDIFNFKSTSKYMISKSFNFFSYSIPYAPQTFDPLLQHGINSKHLLNHLYLTLLKWDKHGNLVPSGAERCDWKSTHLICHLKKNLSFEDGTPIYAQHYLNSINLLKKENLKDTLDFKDITVTAKDNFTLIFKAKTKKLSLKHKLTLIEISARKEKVYYKSSDSVISSTNYKISEYKKNQFIILDKINNRSNTTIRQDTNLYPNDTKYINTNFTDSSAATQKNVSTGLSKNIPANTSNNIKVKIYFIEDQSTALRLYKSKKLNVLTQLPIREVDPYINSTELFYVPMVRMDGMYFSKNLDPNLKKSLFHSLNFSELQFLYKAKGTPGCPTLPRDFYSQDLCYKFDLNLAKSYLKKTKTIPEKIKLTYSTLGGDDIQRGMEWMAHQWTKNLNLNLELNPSESGVFFQKIRDRNFDIIRKGNPLDAPSCVEALFTFSSKNPNDLSSLKDPTFDKILNQMEASEPNSIYDLQKLCDQGLKKLYKDYVFLPLGPIYFSYLDDGLYKGWFINMLNTIDLEELEFKTEDL